MQFSDKHSAFTLIELLVVIAIIAILAIVVVLTLNPAELLRQSRDANRVSDMATLNSALNLYNTDQSGASSFNLGSSSVIYVSLPDSTISGNMTSTCASLGLPTLPAGYAYQCSSPQDYRNSNGWGWIPVNFQNISAGSPISSLPIDPTNQTSSGLYYTYTANGSQYALMAIMESQKYKSSISSPGLGNGIDVQGSNVGTGPVGWWPLNEGTATGTIAYDISGYGDNGTWNGTQAGTSGYYSPGNVSTWAGTFNGGNDYISVGNASQTNNLLDMTLSAWIKMSSSCSSYCRVLSLQSSQYWILGIDANQTFAQLSIDAVSVATGSLLNNSAWHYVAITRNTENGLINLFLDGQSIITTTTVSHVAYTITGNSIGIGAYANSPAQFFPGFIQDVRIYNRPLSPQEIQALYSAKN